MSLTKSAGEIDRRGEIRLENVGKRYGSVTAVEGLTFTVEPGERAVLLGPSGGGKTTTLRLIAGLESVDTGTLYLGGQPANDLDPGLRDIAMVFQNYALYPHMTVWENITFGLRMQGVPRALIETRAREALQLLDLEGLEDRLPRALSGGQRQRVALARAIVKRAPIVLMDEPLSNLDARLRVKARSEIVRLQEKLRFTLVYVTHDQTEAMTIGTRIAVLAGGRLMQYGTPKEVYERPANLFVAGFIGTPPMNLIHAQVEGESLRFEERPEVSVPLPPAIASALVDRKVGSVVIGIRPEEIRFIPIVGTEAAFRDHEPDGPWTVRIPVDLRFVEDVGREQYVYVAWGRTEVVGVVPAGRIEVTSRMLLVFSWRDVHFFDPKSGENLGLHWTGKNVLHSVWSMRSSD
ncbi:carbohydrate ABC transporter ATP-binding protein (CUT1 family) [Brockia lithotrophica]|uniref:Carbohydrate ABC transporter ATP-binding protein (CUT1 family) n=1 Tax=Brockia lithotrophica TaxID=933949 RepID=A0A660L0C7_9BACL|nr:carbohydrate ABC transporter ATP-binding protein (CUT1 family) [Brockia lithotrophica]